MSSRNIDLDENALWKGIQKGNPSSFELLYKRYFKILFSYGRKVCSNSVVVEDAVHDLFIDVWRYHENLSPTTSIKFYLFRALRRKIIKNENKDFDSSIFDFQNQDVFIKSVLSYEDDLIVKEYQDERISMLEKQLHNLSPRHYEALRLRFYEDFSYEEIASILHINQQSARNLIQRGLEQLRKFSKFMLGILLCWMHFLN